MVVIPLTIKGLEVIGNWISSLGNWRHTLADKKKTEVKVALESMLAAVFETKTYLAKRRDDPAVRDLTVEFRLSELWSKAGVDMLPIDHELATRYVMKADYCSDPEGWDTKQNDKTLIELDEVFRRGRDTLLK